MPPEDGDQPDVIAVAWFRRDQWARLRQVAHDSDDLEESYDAWRALATEHFDALKAEGYNVVKIGVDVNDLLRWCRERGYPVNGATRSEFAAELASHQAS
ncbi:MAG: hypothetical protein KKB50_00115 [Planctomycetes bacterium]|nr:hypothetical protein [Planctomycetota bacterium]